MATAADSPVSPRRRGWGESLAEPIVDLGGLVVDWLVALGDIGQFAMSMLSWLVFRLPRRETLLPNFYQIGVLSLPVVAHTGT